MTTRAWFALSAVLGACTGDANTVEISLAPAVISSLDGRTTISTIVAADATPLSDQAVDIAIEYTDRNGTPHAIESVAGTTDDRGVFVATIEGLLWDGTGRVTASSGALSGEATFAVIDRTPPKVTILSPTTDNKVGAGLPIDVQVHVTDEIGVGQIILDTNGFGGGGTRTTTLVSGTLDGTVTFRLDVPGGAPPGPNLQLYALATDLAGNSAAAMPLTLTVDPAITIATPPGLMGSLLVNGTTASLNDPRAIAFSPKDSKLYVADVAGGACNNHCIWQVDPATGVVNPTPVFVGQGVIEGVAFDAAGDNLYYSDRQDRTGRLAWSGTAYTTASICNNVATQRPQDPYHLVFDATLGLLTPDGNGQEVVRIATCDTATNGADFTNFNFDEPRGIALGPTGEIYVSDRASEEIFTIDRNNGNVSVFETRIANPYGLEWLGASATPYASSLLVASQDRVIESTKGMGALAAAYLRNTPIDLALATGTLYVLTSPSQGNRGRIYKVTGF